MNNALDPAVRGELLAAATTLAENLAHSLPLVTYQRAEAALNAHRDASGLLQRYSQAAGAWRARQARGDIAPAEAEQLRALQQAVRSNPVIGEYAQAQQAAFVYLRQINGEISQLLGIDFAAMSRSSGCC